MKYLISGANSSLSRAIAEELTNRGHEVTLVGRDSQPPFNFSNLERHLPALFENHEIFLHLAHSSEIQNPPDKNEQAAYQITNLLNGPASLVKKCIYISSDSASAGTMSNYGKSKFRTERVFLASQQSAVIRLGIIADENVLSPYRKVRGIVEKSRVLAFPNPSKKIFTLTNVKIIIDNIEKIVSLDLSGGPYKDDISAIRKSILDILESDKVKPRVVLPIPTAVLKFMVFAGQKIRYTRKFIDSLTSILTEPETCQHIPWPESS